MYGQQQPSKLILNWTAAVPQGYQCVACDEGTHTMVVVPINNGNGQEEKPCPA